MSDQPPVIWEEPPRRKGGGKPGNRVWEPLLLPLLERPGAWALIKEGRHRSITNAAVGLRQGKIAVPPGRFEIVVRKNGEDTAKLYARYLGTEDE